MKFNVKRRKKYNKKQTLVLPKTINSLALVKYLRDEIKQLEKYFTFFHVAEEKKINFLENR